MSQVLTPRMSPDYVRNIEEFVISRFVISRFYSIHFTVTLAGTKNIVRYIEDFVKSRFHCTRAVARYFGPGIQWNDVWRNVIEKNFEMNSKVRNANLYGMIFH